MLLQATDRDSKSHITYSISGGNPQSQFTIDSLTGKLTHIILLLLLVCACLLTCN